MNISRKHDIERVKHTTVQLKINLLQNLQTKIRRCIINLGKLQ